MVRDMNAKHTPGSCVQVNGRIEGTDGEHIAIVTEYKTLTPRQQANARLIAAAPDLLRALSDLIETITTPYASEVETRLAIKDAKIEISKATGEN